MKIILKILVGLVALVVLLMIVGFFLPREVHLQRTVTIDANPRSVYEEVNNFQNFNKWSPWAKVDPNTAYSYTGPEEGVGAKMTWESEHPDVGNGSQEIVESVPFEKITNRLIFEGFEPSFASIIIEDTGDNSSEVTWTFDGDMGANPVGRYFGLFMENMLGPSYEEGLSGLKEVVENKPSFKTEITMETVEAQAYIGISEYVSNDASLISAKMAQNYGSLMQYFQANNIEIAGYPFAIYGDYSPDGMDLSCALPVSQKMNVKNSDMIVGETFAGNVVKGIYVGDYSGLELAHAEIGQFMEYNNLVAADDPWEVYITDPMQESDTSKWVTHIYYPYSGS